MTSQKDAGGKTDGTGSERPRRPRLVRLACLVTWVVASLAVLYFVAANIFLSTSLFTRVVNADPDIIEIHFQRAWSLVPGYVHAKNVSIRGRDAHVEWRITIDDARFRVSFSSLVKQRFQASDVRARGVSFRFRERLDGVPSAAAVASLPPIAGLPPYSLRPPKAPTTTPTSPPKTGNETNAPLWGLRLESVVAEDVREVWIDHARFEGRARIDGRFFMKPLRAIEVGPAHIAVARGRVSTGEGSVAEGFDGSAFDVTVARFDPKNSSIEDILRGFSLACDTHVALPDLARLPLPLPPDMTLRGALDVRRAVVRLKAGVLQKDSHVVVTASHAVVTAGTHRVRGDLALEAGVAHSPSDHGDRLAFRAEMTELEASHAVKGRDATPTLLRAPKVVATGDSGALGPARFLADLHVVVEVPDGDVADARELSHYIPPTAPVALLSGNARAELRFEAWLDQNRATGRGVLRAKYLDLSLAKMRVRGHASVQAAFDSYHFDTRRLENATLAIEASDAALSSTHAPDTPLVHVDTARLSADAPDVDLADPLRALHVSIFLPAAHVVSRGLLQAYLPKGSEMQIASSHSRFSLNGNLAIDEHLARGTLDLESQDLALDYRDLRLDADLGARARVHAWHWETGALALDDAKIQVEKLAIVKIGAESGRAAMSIARISLGAKSEHFRFDDPLSKVALSAIFVDAKVHDFSAMNAFLPENATFALEGEDATFEAGLDVDITAHSGTGTIQASASNIGAGNKRVHLRGDVGLFARFADWKFNDHTMTLLGSRLEMNRVSGRFAAEGPPQLSAERLFLATSSPNFDLARPTLTGGDFHFVFDKGEVPDARALAPFLSSSGILGIDSGSAHVAADITVSDSRRAADGGVDVTVEHGGVRLNTTHLSGDFRFLARIDGFDPERQVLGLAGTRLEMRNVAVTGATAATSQWRGDVAFTDASLRLRPAMLFDGVLGLDARDARPLLALIFGNDLPWFVVSLTDMPQLAGSMRLIAGDGRLAFLDLQAGGGNVGLRGSYAVRDGHRRGGVVARKAFLSAGVRIDDRGARLRLFGLNRWLSDQRCAVGDRLQMPSAACTRHGSPAPPPFGRNHSPSAP